MPVGIVFASIVGVILMIWIIKRSRAEPKVEFRQDTMRYITIDPGKKKWHQARWIQPQQAAQQEDIAPSPAIEPEQPLASPELLLNEER